MIRLLRSILLIVPFVLVSLVVGRVTDSAPPSTRPVEGLRENPPDVVVFVGAEVVRSAGEEPILATVVIRDGVIADVGPDVVAPDDARVVDLNGKVLYPGFLDAYGEVDVDRSDLDTGTAHWNSNVTPQLSVHRSYAPDARTDEALRSQGIVARLIAPSGGILKGQSALVVTAAENSNRAVIADNVALHARLTPSFGGGRGQYPNSPMGAVALARQTMLDADWYARAWQAYGSAPTANRPEQNDALAALAPAISADQTVIIDAQNELYALRADAFAREFGLRAVLMGSGNEYRRLNAIRATGRTVIVPVDFPQAPNVATAENARHVTLEQLMHWRLAPENPARLHEAGVRFALTSHGLSNRNQFLSSVRKAIERGLPKEAALAAMTTVPAELFGVSDRLGSIARRKAAHLVVADGDLFEDDGEVVSVWIDGREYPMDRPPLFDVRGDWDVRLQRRINETRAWRLELSGSPERLQGKLIVEEPEEQEETEDTEGNAPGPDAEESEDDDEDDKGEIKLKNLTLSDGRLTASFDSKAIGAEGRAMFSAVVSFPKSEQPRLIGFVVLPSGERIDLTATKIEKEEHDDSKDGEENEGEEEEEADDEADDESDEDESDDEESSDESESEEEVDLEVAVNYPLGAFGRDAPPEAPEYVVFRNATIWTCGPEGTIQNASVLIHNGRIEAVGTGDEVDAPRGAVVVNAEGKHLSPGIIDCHSHMATDGGVNESSQAITAEVRIADFIDSDDITIYRQLAGGVTSSNILHGSANPIGGQNQVIKLRWGALPEAMKMHEAPAGIKFALGENVKRSNVSGGSSRYPQTRMGVEQIIRDAFHAAEDYQRQWDAWQRDRRGLPPRRDLELEALAEILQGERWIHCHSYRQDEILALLRTLEEFNITIGSLQHILEGYKVAAEMAAHGATGSSFSDWWAYKFEVYDAIPHNGALMHKAGIVVSFNSDDRELGRHLNHEAAKAVKYGGVPPEEALKFVTLNPAKQLRIDEHTGSIEPGKQADLVLWSGPPLSLYSRCEQTWIDGRKYFDLKEDQDARKQTAELRASLIQAVLGSGAAMSRPGEEEVDEADLWPRDDLFCHLHGHDEHEN